MTIEKPTNISVKDGSCKNFENNRLDPDYSKATDTELALAFIRHIEKPCEAEIEPGKKVNIRDFYIREAKKVLEKMENPHARKLLEQTIKRYEK